MEIFKDKNEVALEAFRYNLNFLTSELNQKVEEVENSIDKLSTFFRTL